MSEWISTVVKVTNSHLGEQSLIPTKIYISTI